MSPMLAKLTNSDQLTVFSLLVWSSLGRADEPNALVSFLYVLGF